jgi:hypothetical protein
MVADEPALQACRDQERPCTIPTGVRSVKPEVLVDVTFRGRPVEHIYEGQSVLYVVMSNHVQAPFSPALESLDDFDVESLGERSLDSTQVTEPLTEAAELRLIERRGGWSLVRLPGGGGRLGERRNDRAILTLVVTRFIGSKSPSTA